MTSQKENAPRLTWLGHGSFRIDTAEGKRVYVDPWLTGPTCPPSEREPTQVDAILLTHGHADHVGETVELHRRFLCPVIAPWELRHWLTRQGVADDVAEALNRGGSTEVAGVTVTLTDARHSSSAEDGTYLGEACGLVVKQPGASTVYFAGDTCAFSDMTLIGRLHAPDIAILPIGDHVTMGPREAAVAAEFVGAPRCLPAHYGTAPFMTGTSEAFVDAVGDIAEIVVIDPGEGIDLAR